MKKTAFLSLMFVFVSFSPAFSATPATPDILTLVATSSTITVTFEANDEEEEITDGYYIKYWKTSDSNAWTKVRFPNPDVAAASYSYEIRGLDNDTEYTVSLTAYDGDDESSATSETVETSSVSVSIKLVATGTLEVGLDEIPSGVETFEVYIGSTAGGSDIMNGNEADSDGVVTQSGLANATYYIRVILKNDAGEDIAMSDETAFKVEDFGTLFSSEDIDDGCFISSTARPGHGIPPVIPFLMVLLTVAMFRFPYKRIIVGLLSVVVFSSMAQAGEDSFLKDGDLLGIKAGLFVPSEKLQDDVYDNIVPVSLFFEKRLGSWLSADVAAGYSKTDGYAVTPSEEQTGVKTELELIPLSLSVNANLEMDPLITVYAGLGVDYWMFREKAYYGESKSKVSGWHGKTGVKLLTGDSNYYGKGGVLLEVSYTAMDRFGRNDVDLGGLTYSLGVMYCF